MSFFKVGELYQVEHYLNSADAIYYQNYGDLQEYTELFLDYPMKPAPYRIASLMQVKNGDVFMVLGTERRSDIQNIINVLHNGQQKWLLVQNDLAIVPSTGFKQISDGLQ